LSFRPTISGAGPDHAVPEVQPVAIADPELNTEAPTQETGSLPRVPDRERRRASATVPQLPAGRYIGVEDVGEVVLLAITADVTHVGRSTGADIVLDDSSVSRRHAILARRGDDTVVLDDRSLNGIRVNGERVTEAVLHNGDRIAVGQVTLRFVVVPS
jgi:pSer/pThr/pTyr-binding forkhead associated (FHA) protein